MPHRANKEVEALSWLQWLQWCTLVIGLVTTTVLYSLAVDENSRETESQFTIRSKEALFHIEQQLLSYTEVLRGVQSHFVIDPDLKSKKFQQVYMVLATEKRLPAIQAIGFSRRNEIHGMAFNNSTPDTQTWPANALLHPIGLMSAGPLDGYQVTYVEPHHRSGNGIGFDQFSETVRRAAMEHARDSGEVVATGPTALRVPENGTNGVVFFMPVYKRGVMPTTIAQRRQSIVGFVFLAVRIDDAFNESLKQPLFQALNLDIYSAPSHGDAVVSAQHTTLLFSSDAARSTKEIGFPDDQLKASHRVSFSGGTWQVDFSADRAAYPPANRWLPSIVAGSGLLGTLVLFFLAKHFHFLNRRSQRQHHATNMALQLRERAIEASANAIIVCRAEAPDYPVEYVNPAFEKMTGYSFLEIRGKNLRIMHRADRDQKGLDEIRATIREKREGHAKLRNYRKDGSMFWTDIRIAPVRNEDGEVTHFVAVKYDITDTKKYEQELEYQANHDVLTGLPNRSLLLDRLRQSIAHAKRMDERFWVAFIDLDRFKYVNDTMGHSAGDQLLQQVARRLQSVIRETDTIARHGGDEFVLIIGANDTATTGTAIIQRIKDVLAQPIEVSGQEFFVTSSIGISAYPADGDDTETLIKNADIAMYRAKEMGRNNFQFYSSSMNEKALDRLKLEKDLRLAIERGEFALHYQPQQVISTGHIEGFEALIRWNHPVHGPISPERFIPMAEETGLIVQIGYWVIQTACVQNKKWHDGGRHQARVAVNVSARQFAESTFADTIVEILSSTGLPPCYLELELTESMVMEQTDYAINVLTTLKHIGVQISIDDFGTGYSSLAYLKRFPLDMLKIDRSFVRDIIVDKEDRSIVDAVISLAHSLGLKVIAEGVEDEAQAEYLWEHGCDLIQGYYLSKPMPVDLVEKFITDNQQTP